MHVARGSEQLSPEKSPGEKRRQLALLCPSAILAVALTVASCDRKSTWPQEGGQLCWQFDNGDTMHLSVNPVGETHFGLTGSRLLTDLRGYVQPLQGSAVVLEDRVRLHLSGSGFNELRAWGYMGNADLDPITLNGIADGLQHAYERPGDKIRVEYSGASTLMQVPCPE